MHYNELQPSYKTQRCLRDRCEAPWKCHYYHSQQDRRRRVARKTAYCPIWQVQLEGVLRDSVLSKWVAVDVMCVGRHLRLLIAALAHWRSREPPMVKQGQELF